MRPVLRKGLSLATSFAMVMTMCTGFTSVSWADEAPQAGGAQEQETTAEEAAVQTQDSSNTAVEANGTAEGETSTASSSDDDDPVTFDGSGTKDEPYIIKTAEQLELLSSNVNSGVSMYKGIYFQLECDINLSSSSSFAPIGTSSYPFKGDFDGNGKSVKLNLTTTNGNTGLFGRISAANIHDLTVTGDVYSKNNAAGVVGWCVSSTISNCVNAASIHITQLPSSSNNGVGGIAGVVMGTGNTIADCINDGVIDSSMVASASGVSCIGFGGIVGLTTSNATATVSNCTNNGTILNAPCYSGVGGIAGLLSSTDFTIESCTNTGDVSVTGNMVIAYNGVGGIIGYVRNSYKNGTTVSQSCNTGNVTGRDASNANTGGVIGCIYDTKTLVDECYNAGDISAPAGHVGGVAGQSNGKITSTYNAGAVSNTKEGTASSSYIVSAGGLVGYTTSKDAKIAKSYSYGSVTSTATGSYAAGVIGCAYTSSISSDYIYSDTYLDSSASLGIGNMSKDASDYAAFSASNKDGIVTTIGSAFKKDLAKQLNGGYPILRWQDSSSSYQVAFAVTDAQIDAVSLTDRATVAVKDKETGTEQTAADGKYELYPGSYTYTVAVPGYETENGEFTVKRNSKDVNVALTSTKHSFTFTVEPANATVSLSNGDAPAGTLKVGDPVVADGIATYTFNLGDEQAYGKYTVSASCYTYEEASTSVKASDGSASVSLKAATTHALSLDVTPKDAKVIITNDDWDAKNTAASSADGSWKFNLIDGNYSYKVKASGYTTKTGTFTMDGSDKTLEAITLASKDAWDGTSIDTDWYTDDPDADGFVISEPEELAGLAALVNGTSEANGKQAVTFEDKTIYLAKDIDLGGKDWTRIGEALSAGSFKYFKGTFNGNGHSISNLAITLTGSGSGGKNQRQGLFGSLDGATVENLKVVNANIATSKTSQAYNNVGIIAGYASQTVFSNITVSGSLANASTSNGGAYVGGIVGTFAGGTMTACINKASVAGDYQAGGIVGRTYTSQCAFYRCANYGAVSTSYDRSTTSYSAGGIIGLLYCKNDSVKQCVNYGSVTAAGASAGGIVGCNDSDSKSGQVISDCYNMGSVSSTTETASNLKGIGGIIGYMCAGSSYYGFNTLSSCYNAGTLTKAVDTQAMGGIIGYMNSTSINGESIYGDYYLANTAYTGACNSNGQVTASSFTAFSASNVKSGSLLSGVGASFGPYVDGLNGCDANKTADAEYPILRWQNPASSYAASFELSYDDNSNVSGEPATYTVTSATDGSQVYTGSEPSASLPSGLYTYSVELRGYNTATGEFSINQDTATIDVRMTAVTYEASIVVGTGFDLELVKTAPDGTKTIVHNPESVTSEEDQTDTYTFALTNGTYSYTAKKLGYVKQTGSFEISYAGLDAAQEVPATPKAMQKVTANITPAAGSFAEGDPVVTIVVKGGDFDGTQLWPSSSGSSQSLDDGVQFPVGTYSYSVKAAGFRTARGEFTLEEGADYAIAAELQAKDGWYGDIDTDWYTLHADQTEFTISTEEELAGLAQLVNDGTTDFSGKTVKLAADMNLNDSAWTPIGGYNASGTKKFCGTFDGQGHSITMKNAQMEQNEASFGLFGWLENAQVKNLVMQGNTVIECTDESSASYVMAYAGALAGYAGNSSILNCSNQMSVKVRITKESGSVSANLGGLVGWGMSTAMESCSNLGHIDVQNAGSGNVISCAGGLVGYLYSSANGSQLVNCYNTGAMSVKSISTGAYATANAAGLVGRLNGSTFAMSNCYAASSVSAVASGYSGSNKVVAPLVATGTDGTYTNNYYLYDNIDSAVSAKKKTQEQMQSPDFVTLLNGVGGSAYAVNPNGGYPILSWEKGITRLEVTSQPTKLEYNDLEDFDDSGLKLVAYSGDDDTTGTVVNSGWTVVDGKELPAGKTAVTIDYKGATTQIPITVTAIDHQITSDDLVFSLNAPTAGEKGATSLELSKSQAKKIKSAKVKWTYLGKRFSGKFEDGCYYRAHVTLYSNYTEDVLQWVFNQGATPQISSALEILNYEQSEDPSGKLTTTEFDVTFAPVGYNGSVSPQLFHGYYSGDTGSGKAYDFADDVFTLSIDGKRTGFTIREMEQAVIDGELETCTRALDDKSYLGINLYDLLIGMGLEASADDDTVITFSNGNSAADVELTFGELRQRTADESAIIAFANVTSNTPLGSGEGPIMLLCGDTTRTGLTGITVGDYRTVKTQSLAFNVVFSDGLDEDADITVRDGYGNKLACTASKGNVYSIDLRDGDTYTYRVTADGYNVVTGQAKLDGDDAAVDITLNPVWDGETTTEPQQDEDGTYLIGTAAELMWWHDNYGDLDLQDSSVKLTNDIALNSGENDTNLWETLGINSGYGSGTLAFNGTFDGNGHVIRNILIQRENTYELKIAWDGSVMAYADRQSEIGFFGYTSGNAKIVNLGIEGNIDVFDRPDGSLADWMQVGGIVGLAQGNTQISNCYTNMAIKAVASTETETVGGYPLAGYGYVTDTYMGGIAGSLSSNATIDNCYSKGTLIGAETRQVSIGGIAGAQRYSENSVTNCYSTANIESYPLSNSTWDSYLGGVVGYNYNNSTAPVSNSYALNQSISSSGTLTAAGKVTGRAAEGALSNNYGLDAMTINGPSKSSDTGASTINGQSITVDEAQMASSYSAWSTASWNLSDGSYPMLAWQKVSAGDDKTTTYNGQTNSEEDEDDWDGYFGSQSAPPYFKVYAKVGSQTVLLKKFTRKEMQEMAAADNEGTLYYSSLSYSGYAGRAVKEYVYIDTLLDAAGAQWSDGDAIVMGSYRYDLTALTADRYYYPDWTSGSSEGAVKVKPVIALKSNGAKSGMSKELFSMYAQQADYLYAYMLTFGQASPENYTYNYFMYQQTSMSVDYSVAARANSTLTGYLSDQISSASDNLDATFISDDGSEVDGASYYVDQDTHDAFNAAIEEAQSVLNSTEITNSDVMNAITALDTAQTKFNKLKQKGKGIDTGTFWELYNEAVACYQAVNAASVDGSDVHETQTWTTVSAYEALRAAISEAERDVYGAESQLEVDQLCKSLRAAIDSFTCDTGYIEPQTRKTKAALVAEELANLDTSKYTDDQLKQLQELAKDVIGNIKSAATVKDINAAYREGMESLKAQVVADELANAKAAAKNKLQELVDGSGLTGSALTELQAMLSEYGTKIDAATTTAEVERLLGEYQTLIANRIKLASAGSVQIEADQAVYKLSYSTGTATLVGLTSLGKKLSTITVPATVTYSGATYKVTSISSSACSKQVKATKLIVGNNVVTIGKKAFAGCKKLQSVTLGTNVKNIKAKAFANCKKLKTVTITSKKLTKASVKNLVKSSKIKRIKAKNTKNASVKLSVSNSQKTNKKYAKKYSKWAKAYKKSAAAK